MLNNKDHTEKYLRAMHRELDHLEIRQRHAPVHELIPPIQRGWKRHFVMTPAARLRPDAPLLETILAHLNTVQYFWRPDFRPTRRQRNRRHGLISIEQELMAIRCCEWGRSLLATVWRKYFRCEFLSSERLLYGWPDRTGTEHSYPRLVHLGQRGFQWGYAFRFPSLFELRIEKHWLTHYIEIEPGVAGRIAEIERWMDFHLGRERFSRLKGRSHSWRRWDQAAHRRDDRRTQREMRSHLGFPKNEAADHIPSTTPCGGHGGWDVFSRTVLVDTIFKFFAAVRLEILRHQQPDTRPGGLTGHRHSGQGSQALASRGGPFRVGPRGARPRRPGAPAAIRRRRLPVQSSSKRTGSAPVGFLRKTNRARSPWRPGGLFFR